MAHYSVFLCLYVTERIRRIILSSHFCKLGGRTWIIILFFRTGSVTR